MNATELDALRDRIESLEQRVAELEDESATVKSDSTTYDRYDEAALDVLNSTVENAHPREIIRAYDTAGIVDEKKKKERAKRLKRLGGK